MIQFNESFRSRLQDRLLQNSGYLKESSLTLLTDAWNSGRQNIARYIGLIEIDGELQINLNEARLSIETLISREGNLKLKIRTYLAKEFYTNEIYFLKESNDKSNLISKALERRFFHEMDSKSEKLYWSENLGGDYERISGFECFIEEVFDRSKVLDYQQANYRYNVSGWISYLDNLIEKNFEGFVLNRELSGKTKRFVKQIDQDVFIGIEYNPTSLRSEIRRKGICFPQYLNLIILNNQFDGHDKQDYIFDYHSNIMSLGILGNPLFFEPVFPLGGFAVAENHKQSTQFPFLGVDYPIKHKQIEKDTFVTVHPAEFGEKLKRHAYYYMDLLEYSSKGYLEYVEKSVREALKK